MSRKSLFTGVLAALLGFGCQHGSQSPAVVTVAGNLVIDNGISLNGISLNGISLNGVSLNGISLNGISLNGISLNGISLNGISLNGASLAAVTGSGEELSGGELVGSTFQGILSNGGNLSLRLDSHRADEDVSFYRVSYLSDQGWQPLCRDEDGTALEAIPLSGRWNYGQGVPGGGAHIPDPGAFTLACRGRAIAKCVELGYKPWKTVEGVNLAAHHQACTRLLRADYCGDGSSWTFDGWKVNLYDDLEIQTDTERGRKQTWQFEATWGPGGALCLAKARAADLVAQGALPACVLAKIDNNCNSSSEEGLLRNEYRTLSVATPIKKVCDTYPGTKLAESFEDVLEQMAKAEVHLAAVPTEWKDAVEDMKQAVDKLEDAYDHDLMDSGFAIPLLDRFPASARKIATDLLTSAEATPGHDAGKVEDGYEKLAKGDQEWLDGEYTDAVHEYKDAVGKAMDAIDGL